MSAPRWHWLVIAVWLAACSIGFIASDSTTARSWLLLLVFGIIPSSMLLSRWNEDRVMLIGSLRRGEKLGATVRDIGCLVVNRRPAPREYRDQIGRRVR